MRKNLKISEQAHDIIKKYCDDNHLKISNWASSVLIQKVEENNRCTSTESLTQKTESVI